MKSAFSIILFSCFSLAFAQVKVGDNINTIDGSSLLELESTTKALVLTRLSTAEMTAITPLNGALVYNTDINCVHYYNGSTWINLCDTTNTGGMLADNLDGTYTFTDSNGVQITFRADDDISGLTFDGTNITIDEGATTFSADLSSLEESADIAAVQADVDQNEADSDAADAANSAAIAANAADILAHNTTDGDLSSTNELSDVTLNGTTIELTNPEAGATGVDLNATFTTDAELAAAADDDITGVTFDGTNITVDEGATTFSADLSSLEESADIAAVQADVDQNEADSDAADAANSAAIAANAADILAHNTADGDLSSTNELSDVTLNGTTIELTNPEAGATGVDLNATFATDAELAAAADDDITGVTFDGTNITVDEGATTFSADLSSLEESADIAAVQADVDQNEADSDVADAAIQADVDQNEVDSDAADTANAAAIATNATDIAAVQADVDQNEVDSDAADAANAAAIATNATDIATNAANILAHNTADGDLSSTNELSDVALNGTTIELTNPAAGATGVDLNATFATDAELAAAADDDITGVTFNGTNITVDEGATTFSADLSSLEESADIGAVQADVDQNEADSDAADVAIQADVDQNEADSDATDAVNATAIAAEEARALAAEATIQAEVDQNKLDSDAGDASNAAAITAHIAADGDLSDTNEVNTAFEVSAGNLRITDANSTLDVPLTNFDSAISQVVTAGNVIATHTGVSGTTTTNILETITSLESITGSEATLRYTNEAGGFNDIPNIVRSVNGVNPAANGNVAVILSSVNVGLEADLPATGIDADVYIVAGEVAPNADRNGVSFIYDDPTGWQEITTDLSTTDARYVNIIGDAMTGPLSMGSNNIVNLNNPTNAQDAATKSYVDNQLAVSDAADLDMDPTNEIQALDFSTGVISLSNDPSATDIDLSNYDTNVADDFDGEWTSLSNIPGEIVDGDDNTQLTNAEVAAAAIAEGFVVGPHTVDTDTQLTEAEVDAFVANNGYSTGAHTVDTDTQLTEAEVDAFVANNGYLTTEVDGDATNEIQTLSISGNDLTISGNGGNTVTLPAGSATTGSTGSVFFADTDGTVTENNAALFWDNTNERLGIGTTAPTANLEITNDGVPLRIQPSAATPTGTQSGQIFMGNDGILYTYDGNRSKWLSVDRTMVGWGFNSNNTSNRYLRQFNGADSSNNGWRMVRDGTITAISAQSNINQTWTLEIRKNDAVGVVTSLTMTNVQGNESSNINVDINQGDFLQAYVNGTSVDYPEVLIEIAWRK